MINIYDTFKRDLLCLKHRLKYFKFLFLSISALLLWFKNQTLAKNFAHNGIHQETNPNPDSQLHRLVKKNVFWGWGYKKRPEDPPWIPYQCADITKVQRYNIGWSSPE